MLTLYDNAFSPFARKVRMVLEFKNLPFTTVDGLDIANHAALKSVNRRSEVPVLVDDEVTVVNSAHIVTYLEDAYPDPSVLPATPAARVRARHWERISDTLVDAIVVDVSLWSWANRSDAVPEGLNDKARHDLESVMTELNRELGDAEYLCGDRLSIADIALFPHMQATRSLDIGIDFARFPKLTAWLRRMRTLPIVRADLDRLKGWLANIGQANFERDRIFWRGDRIEWLLASGYHAWFLNEIEQGRVLWPSTSIA